MANDHITTRHPRYLAPIPLDISHNGARYIFTAVPLDQNWHKALGTMPGWFTLECDTPNTELKKIGAVVYHPTNGWIGMSQTCDKALVKAIVEELRKCYE